MQTAPRKNALLGKGESRATAELFPAERPNPSTISARKLASRRIMVISENRFPPKKNFSVFKYNLSLGSGSAFAVFPADAVATADVVMLNPKKILNVAHR